MLTCLLGAVLFACSLRAWVALCKWLPTGHTACSSSWEVGAWIYSVLSTTKKSRNVLQSVRGISSWISALLHPTCMACSWVATCRNTSPHVLLYKLASSHTAVCVYMLVLCTWLLPQSSGAQWQSAYCSGKWRRVQDTFAHLGLPCMCRTAAPASLLALR